MRADTTVCIGSGNCVRLAAAVFDQDDDEGVVVVLDSRPGADVERAVRAAVSACPTGAISIDEES